jgi:hypothetical protein
MANQQQHESQLVPLADVAAATTVAPVLVERAAGKDVVRWWDGSVAVTFATARRILAEMRTVEADETRKYLQSFADRDQGIRETQAAAQRHAAERERQHPRRVPSGIKVSLPGEPRPDWMGGSSVEEES